MIVLIVVEFDENLLQGDRVILGILERGDEASGDDGGLLIRLLVVDPNHQGPRIAVTDGGTHDPTAGNVPLVLIRLLGGQTRQPQERAAQNRQHLGITGAAHDHLTFIVTILFLDEIPFHFLVFRMYALPIPHKPYYPQVVRLHKRKAFLTSHFVGDYGFAGWSGTTSQDRITSVGFELGGKAAPRNPPFWPAIVRVRLSNGEVEARSSAAATRGVFPKPR
jgi:hypothetical protein